MRACSGTKSCLTVTPMDCNWLGSSVHGIFQARILGWVAIFFSRGCSDPRIKPVSPEMSGGFFVTESPGKPLHEESKF